MPKILNKLPDEVTQTPNESPSMERTQTISDKSNMTVGDTQQKSWPGSNKAKMSSFGLESHDQIPFLDFSFFPVACDPHNKNIRDNTNIEVEKEKEDDNEIQDVKQTEENEEMKEAEIENNQVSCDMDWGHHNSTSNWFGQNDEASLSEHFAPVKDFNEIDDIHPDQSLLCSSTSMSFHPEDDASLSENLTSYDFQDLYEETDIQNSASSTLSAQRSMSKKNRSNGQQRFKPFHEEKWNIRFKEFESFVQEHGHGAVPHTYPQNQQLARWVKRQRHQYKLLQDGKPSTMTYDRVELLNTAGFVWDSHEVTWRERLESLKRFCRVHGHANVPAKYKEQKLGTWVKCQRRQYKLYREGKISSMNPDRIQELDRLGFEWEIRNVSSKNTCTEDMSTRNTYIEEMSTLCTEEVPSK